LTARAKSLPEAETSLCGFHTPLSWSYRFCSVPCCERRIRAQIIRSQAVDCHELCMGTNDVTGFFCMLSA